MKVSPRLVLLSAVILAGAPAEAQVYNLHLVTDNQPDYTDMKSFVESSTGAWDEPEEKAIAVWRWGRRSRRQLSCSREGTRYIADPILNYNSYGALNCGIISALNIGSWLELGYQARYVQLGDHTVSEVSWDGGRSWHMFDSSMSVFCYNHAGQVASCEEIKEAHGCELSGGKDEPGHYYLYHPAPQCASHLGPTGWRSASDNPVEFNRTLLAGASSYTDGFSIDRYCQNARYGHRYVLNIRPSECYARFWTPLDGGHLDPKKKNPDYFRPLPDGLDPDGRQGVCNVRSNGSWGFQPDLSDPACQELLFDSGGQPGAASAESPDSPPVVFSKTSPKLRLADGLRAGYAVFQVSAANVITSMSLAADILCGRSPGAVRILVSRNAGIGWQEVWRSEKSGRQEVRLKLREQVAGTPFCLIKIELARAEEPVGLDTFRVFTTTLVNKRTLPALTLGSNEIVLHAGEQAETLELWPFLHAGLYKETVFAEEDVFSDELPDGMYKATLGSAVNNKECSATWRLVSPTDILDVSYVVVSTVRTDRHWVSLEHSWDGEHFEPFYRHTKSDFPLDRRTERRFAGKEVPAGARQAFFRAVFFSPSGAATYNMAGIQDLLIRIHRKPRSEAFKPLHVTFSWTEHRDGGDKTRSHSELVTSLPHRYRINVIGKRDPTMHAVQVSAPGYVLTSPGYSDGLDEGPGCEYPKVAYRWGKNVAQGKPYTASRPSSDSSKNPDSGGRELTNGLVIAPTESTTTNVVQPATAFWDAGEPVRFVIDLGSPHTVAGVRAGAHQPNARYCHPKTVEVAVSPDGQGWEPAGVIRHDDLWKPPGDYEPWEHDDHPRLTELPAGGRLAYCFPLVFPKPLAARFVRFSCTPLEEKGMGLSEFQVFDKAEAVPWPAEIRFPAVQVGPTGQREAEEGLFDRYLFSADGKYLLSCGPWGLAVLWAAEDGAFVRIVRRNGECRNGGGYDPHPMARVLDISPDGKSLVAARGTLSEPRLSLEETETGKRIHVFPVRPKTDFPWICFSDDGRYLIGSGSRIIGEPAEWTKPPLEIWDTRTGRRVWDPDQPPPYTAGELEKARQALPEELGKSGRLTPEHALADLKLLLLLRMFRDDGRPLVARGTLRGHGPSFFTPDGSRLITRDSIMPYTEYSSEAVFWDIGRSALLYEMEEDDELSEPFLFSADGRHFLRKAWEKSRGLYETASGRRRGTFDDLPATGAEAITADGRLALLTAQRQAILFDIPAGKSLQDYPIEGNSSYRAVFSPRGDRLLLGFKEHTEVHETRPPFRRLFRLEHAGAQRGRSNHAAFSPDGRRIVCADALWNAETGGRLRQFRVNAGLVFSAY